jgi:3-oxoacyl-[acyl-carrier-protein] synthase II
MKRIVITGMGALTPIGNTVETFWQNLLAGKSGAGKITHFETGDMPYNIACQVKDFDPTQWLDKKTARRTHRSSQFAVAVARMALTDAGVEVTPDNWNEIGVLMATGGGGINEIEAGTIDLITRGWRAVGPFVVPAAMANAVSCVVSIETGARGPVMTSTAACAAGHYSVLEAYHFLMRGECDYVIAGGAESAVSMLTMSAFGRMGPLSSRTDDPEHACRPFSVDRDGFVCGEGAAAFLMETEENALARGAHIYAEVLGGKLTGDAYHVTAPEPEGDGATRAIAGALKNCGLQPADVDMSFAHGTGTVLNDKGEAKAIRRALGEVAYQTPITSIKSMVGHGLGAAGAHSVAAAVCALNSGMMPPTINYTPDPEIDLPIVGNVAQRVERPRHAIVNAFGFGGQNVVVVLRKYEA